ncbi:MAG: PLDc N-terminal domain-containing protein [Actinomycetia bacterium]|nr:PLDc N-terminal domain-containing protein [Actinomycetes bacterium]
MGFTEAITALIGITTGSFFLIVVIFFIFAASIISLGLFVLWIITLVDCVKRDDEDFAVGGSNAKLIWILLLVLINNIVPIIYYFLIMHKKPAKNPKKSSTKTKG